jgi:hypothetical protein
MPDPSAVQILSITSSGGWAGNFDTAVDVGSTILMAVSGHGGAGRVSTSDPLYDGSAVTGATKLVNLDSGDFGGNINGAALDIWLLPNVQSSGTSLSITTTASEAPYIGILAVDLGNIGSDPVVIATGTLAQNSGSGQSTGEIGPIDVPAFVFASDIQDGTLGNLYPPSGWTSQFYGGSDGTGNSVGGYLISDGAGESYTYNVGPGSAGEWVAAIVAIGATVSGVSVSGAINLKKMVVSGASAEKAVVTAALKLKKMVLSGVSAEKAVVTGTVKLKKMVVAASSAEKAVVTAAIKLKKMVLSVTSVEPPSVVTSTITLKKMVLSGVSHERAVATAVIRLKKVVLSGAGTEKSVITGVIQLHKMRVSGSSHEKAVVTGSVKLHKMRVHAEQAKRKSSVLFVLAPP